jgi:hypothetical protein
MTPAMTVIVIDRVVAYTLATPARTPLTNVSNAPGPGRWGDGDDAAGATALRTAGSFQFIDATSLIAPSPPQVPPSGRA